MTLFPDETFFSENTHILYDFFSSREAPIKEIAAIAIDYTKPATVESFKQRQY